MNDMGIRVSLHVLALTLREHALMYRSAARRRNQTPAAAAMRRSAASVLFAAERSLRESAAIAIETRQGGDVQQAPSRSDESAGRQASPRSSRPSSDKERE